MGARAPMLNGAAMAGALLMAAGLLAPAPARAQSYTATWTQMKRAPYPPAGPMGDAWLKLAYDTASRRTVLIGGSGSAYANDVLHYDAGLDEWTVLEPWRDCKDTYDFAPMAKRDEHVVEHDPVNGLYWIFGGSGFNCKYAVRTAQAGTTTTAVVDGTLPAGADDFYKDWTVEANGIKAYVAGYSAATRTLSLATPISGLLPGGSYLLFPQRGGGTWHYSPVTGAWGSLDGPHWGYAGPSPVSRLSPGFAYSPRHQAMVMHGGSMQRNDTWALDLLTRAWVRMLPVNAPGAPPPRIQIENAMVYDEDNDVFILFGGKCDGAGCGAYGAPLNETWAYSLPSNAWTKLSPASIPPPRDQTHMAYDPVNKVTVMFGGRGAAGALNDLWVFDYAANRWTELFPASSPPPQRLGSMVYDPDAGVMVFYHRQVWTLRITSTPASDNPVPAMGSLSPAGAAPGGPALALTVTGGGFLTSSVVHWNGSPRPTALVSPTQLRADIAAADIAAPGTAAVTVVNPPPGGGTSNALSFPIIAAGKDLVIEGLSVPAGSVEAGGSLTVSYKVVNRGSVTVAETYTDRMYLSAAPTLGSGEVLLGASHGHTADLAAGASHAASQAITIPAGTAGGSHYLLVQADALGAVAEVDEGNNVTAIPLTVMASAPVPGEIVLDNAAAGAQDAAGGRTFTGKWCKSSAPAFFGADSLYSCGSGADTYRWTPTIPAAASYDVYVRWTSNANRSSGVPVKVNHSAGQTQLSFNQRAGGGLWQLHGRYLLPAGTTAFVETGEGAGGNSAADAVRLVPVP